MIKLAVGIKRSGWTSDLYVLVHAQGHRNVFHSSYRAIHIFCGFIYPIFCWSCLSYGYQDGSNAELSILWEQNSTLPKGSDVKPLTDIEFHTIKPYEFSRDGYRFLHGVALAWHREQLFASFGHNKGSENSQTEEARWRVSRDGGKTWGPTRTMHNGYGISHGVFLNHQNRLWAFHGACPNFPFDVYTRAFRFDDEQDRWDDLGKIIGDGFWPMQEPLLMEDDNWIMAGLQCDHGNHAAVAISHGSDFLHWDLIVIPAPAGIEMWGESTVIVAGKRVLNVARYGKKAVALVSESQDYGRTWSPCRESNLPMVTSKPYAGTLSTGENYLIATTTADSGNRRSPLTIALSRPGELFFSRVFVLRNALQPNAMGESHRNAALSYPYAIEHAGKLYVGYSNNGGNVGRVGEGKQLWNNNSAELAIIPISQLIGGEEK